MGVNNHSIPKKTMVVIPAFHPSVELHGLAEDILRKGYRLLVVDDGSGLQYELLWMQLEKSGAVVLHHPRNQGKGNALKTAFQYILMNHRSEIRQIVTMDADGQHLVSDMEKVVQASASTPGKLILGVRKFDGKVPFRSRAGNRITCLAFRLTAGIKVSDTQTGLRAFSIDLLEWMSSVSGSRYEYEMNVLTRCSREGIGIEEVAIQTIYLDEENSASHFRAVRDSIRIYRDLFWFTSVSMCSFLLDYLLFLLLSFLTKGWGASLIFSNVSARLISGSFNYFLNSRAVFRDNQPVRKTLPQYVALAVCILTGNSIVLSFLVNTAGIPEAAAKIMTEMIFFLISYTVQSLLIFRKKIKESG